jgi:hypothetical protein
MKKKNCSITFGLNLLRLIKAYDLINNKQLNWNNILNYLIQLNDLKLLIQFNDFNWKNLISVSNVVDVDIVVGVLVNIGAHEILKILNDFWMSQHKNYIYMWKYLL